MEDADISKDKRFAALSRIYRYLAISRRQSDELGKPLDVVTDIRMVKEREKVPCGFLEILKCADNNEKALKKRRFCVRLSPRMSAQLVLIDITLLSRKPSQFSQYQTAIELHGLYIVLKYANKECLPTLSPSLSVPEISRVSSADSPRRPPPPIPSNSTPTNVGLKTGTIGHSNPLADIPFSMSGKYSKNSSTNGGHDSRFQQLYKSADMVALEYSCDFSLETSVLASTLQS